jgi:hypothetical protein
MNGVAVRDQPPDYCVDSCDAIVDNGTTYMLDSKDEVTRLMKNSAPFQ